MKIYKFQKMSKLLDDFDSVSTIKTKLTVSIEPEYQVFLNFI